MSEEPQPHESRWDAPPHREETGSLEATEEKAAGGVLEHAGVEIDNSSKQPIENPGAPYAEDPSGFVHDIDQARVMADAYNEEAEKTTSDWEQSHFGNKAADKAGEKYEIERFRQEKRDQGAEEPLRLKWANTRLLLDFGHNIAENQRKYGEQVTPNQLMLEAVRDFVIRVQEGDQNDEVDEEKALYALHNVLCNDGYIYTIESGRTDKFRDRPPDDDGLYLIVSRRKGKKGTSYFKEERFNIDPWKGRKDKKKDTFYGAIYFVKERRVNDNSGPFEPKVAETEGYKSNFTAADAEAFKKHFESLEPAKTTADIA